MDNLVKDLKRKIAQLEQKNKKIAQKLQSKRSSLRYYQARCRQLLQSRDNWKSKAQVRLNPSKPSFRISQETFGGPIPARHQYSAALIFFCIQLRVKAGCSYRNIVLVLQILMEQASSQQRLPCVNTLKNWVEKLGLFLLSRRPSWSGQAVLIVDELIGRAQERLLMCLLVCRSPSAGQALDTSCVQVVHLEARPQWRGQDIAQVIGGIEQKLGQPISYLLSDGDHKLTKAARELGRAHQWDISHFLARALRKTFEDSPEYKAFIQSLGAWRAHSVCSSLSLLAPPKQRAKAAWWLGTRNWGSYGRAFPLKPRSFLKSIPNIRLFAISAHLGAHP